MDTFRVEHVMQLQSNRAEGDHVIHHNVYIHFGERVERALDRISFALFRLIDLERDEIMPILDDLEAKVTAQTGVAASAATLLKTIHDELTAAIAANDPVRLQALADHIEANTDALSAAVAANPDPAASTT